MTATRDFEHAADVAARTNDPPVLGAVAARPAKAVPLEGAMHPAEAAFQEGTARPLDANHSSEAVRPADANHSSESVRPAQAKCPDPAAPPAGAKRPAERVRPSKATRPSVLVLAAVAPGSGPGKKMAALAAAFRNLGCSTRSAIVAPTRHAHSQLRTALETGVRPDLVLLRSHWTVPMLSPILRRLKSAGTRVVVDSPSPVAAGVREITGSHRAVGEKLLRLAVETTWTPLAWPLADVMVQYETEGWPWRTLASNRRITLTNGVDVAARPLAPGWAERRTFHLVAAGTLAQWHGYDRLIAALPNHPEVTLTVVGDGPELANLWALVAQRQLASRVRFTGTLTGAAFDDVMATADVGVSSLGEHRRGSFALSPLKTRDYLARGLPVLFAGADPDLRADPNFAYRVPATDAPVDLAGITAWLDRTRRDRLVSPVEIRAFAQTHLDMTLRAAAILAACS